MESQASEFGFEVLTTYLLPGMVAVLAVAFGHGFTTDQIKALSIWAKDAELIASLSVLALITLCGALIATLQAALETWVLDRVTPRLMGIPRADFQKHWSNYISKLKDHENTYISRVVLFFQFETRLGLSAFILSYTLFPYSCTHSIGVFFAALFFYGMGIYHHKELGEYRAKNCA